MECRSSNLEITSGYIYQQNPNRYGREQEDYLVRSEEAISDIVNQIHRTSEKKSDLQSLFHQILEDLGKIRHKIAEDHQSNNAKLFGQKRSEYEILKGHSTFTLTCLIGEYEEYNQKMLKLFQKHISTMKHDLKEFQQKSLLIEEKYGNRLSTFKFEVLDNNDLKDQKWTKVLTIDEIATVLGVSPESVSDKFDLITLNNMKNLKEKAPKLYHQEKIATMMWKLAELFPSPKRIDDPHSGYYFIGNTENLKSLFVRGTSRLEINGKMYALSQYLTWMYCTWSEDPVERMVECSKVIVIHHDTFLIEETLKDIAKTFERAVLWNRDCEDIGELKAKVALLRYEFAHVMPFARGSASIGEWLETAIYHYHGFTDFQYKEGKLGDLEALTSLTFSDFIKSYDSTISLESKID